MYTGKLVFAQAMDHLPLHTFRRCVQRYGGNRHIKSFTCQDQYRCMAFAQLTYRESSARYRSLPQCPEQQALPYGYTFQCCPQHAGRRQREAGLAHLCRLRPVLIQIARRLYVDEDLGLELDNTVYALDATTIDLCLSVSFPGRTFANQSRGQTAYPARFARQYPIVYPYLRWQTARRQRTRRTLARAGAFYVMDRGYLDFARLYQLNASRRHSSSLAPKSNLQFRRRLFPSRRQRRRAACDQTVVLTGFYTRSELSRQASPHQVSTMPRPTNGSSS